MSYVVRPATADDLPTIYQMAKSTGGGFTNLPPDRDLLAARLARAGEALRRDEDGVGDDLFFFVMENPDEDRVSGTCQILSRVGSTWPFYSYRIGALTQHSRELDRTFRAETLTLTTELDGCSEIGGLYLRAQERSAGIGALLARSRYLFIAMHRLRFGSRTIAELRGVHDEAGGSPFWDGVAGRFFGMTFHEADQFNAQNGNQFIADLMPRHPLYLAMLDESALAAIGVPHQSGRAAMRMLEAEGFVYDQYVDIFDGGPTMTVATDAIATIRNACRATIADIRPLDEGTTSIVACGRLMSFRATQGRLIDTPTGLVLDEGCAARLGVAVGADLVHVPR